MAQGLTSTRARRSLESLRSDWVEIGGLGKLAVVGLVLAFGLTLVLGFSITRSARGHLLEARAASVVATVDDLPPFPGNPEGPLSGMAAFDLAVRVKLLGGETVRVKVWGEDGEIVYSDSVALRGLVFALPDAAVGAFSTGLEVAISDLREPSHYLDTINGELIEVFTPLISESSSEVFVIEVEQDASGLTRALSQITRNVWASIGVGLFAIGLVMAFGVAERTREVNRRRRQAEGLLEANFKAQEDERTRVVGSLHDDIGQPMYRLLYGLEGSRAKLDDDDPVAVELANLSVVVRDMDATLRNELRLLHSELAGDAGLVTALEELTDLTRSETDLDVELVVELDSEPSRVSRTEIYRAAREAVTNVRKHASADSVEVHVYRKAARLVLDVTDNGTGIDADYAPGLGLSTTQQRFAALDGDVTVNRDQGGGTRFRAWLPFVEEDGS